MIRVGCIQIDHDSCDGRSGAVQSNSNSLHTVLIHGDGLLSSGGGGVGELQNQAVGVGRNDDVRNYGRCKADVDCDFVAAHSNTDLTDFRSPAGRTLGGRRRHQKQKQMQTYQGPHGSPSLAVPPEELHDSTILHLRNFER